MIKIGNTEITDVKLGSTQVNKVYVGSDLVWQKNVSPYNLYMWLNGQDAPSSSKWVDTISGFSWALTGVTHNADNSYYGFANPASGVATKYAAISKGGASIDLGTAWKVEADIDIGNTTQAGYIMDFCSYGTVSTNYKGLGFSFSAGDGASVNVKPNGNTGIAKTVVSGTSITLPDTWNRFLLTWECVDVGNSKSVINCYVDNVLVCYTDEFTTVNWNNFRQQSSPYNEIYLGRGALNSNNYHAPLRCRIYDLKIYKHV